MTIVWEMAYCGDGVRGQQIRDCRFLPGAGDCALRHRSDLMQDMLKSERTFCKEEPQRISTETLGSQSL